MRRHSRRGRLRRRRRRRLSTLLVRADGGARVGGGHVLRQLALAEAWATHGGRAVLVSAADLPPGLAAAWRDEGHEVVVAPDAPGNLAGLADRVEAAWVALDGYDLPTALQDELADRGPRVLVVDDHGAAGRYAVDLVVDQNLGASPEAYADRRQRTGLLLGPRYALLRREFGDRERGTSATVRRVLVSGGWTAPPGLLDELGTAVNEAVPDAETVVLAEVPVAEVAERLAGCDLAVAAAGSTCWELCCVGVPAVLVAVAANQAPMARALATLGAAVDLGPAASLDRAALVDTLTGLSADRDRRAAMASAGRAVVDGRGAARVAAALRAGLLRVRPVETADARLLWEWANDPAVRQASFSPGAIGWGEHLIWLVDHLADGSSHLYVVEDAAGRPVGHVRFQAGDRGRVEIGVSVAADRRGQGWGAAVIRAGLGKLCTDAGPADVHALVKTSNEASVRAFDLAGFERAADEQRADETVLHLVWDAREAGVVPVARRTR